MTAKKKEETSGFTPAVMAAAARGDIANVVAAMTPGGIERQEAAGQRSFVASETLPIKTNYCTREQLEKIGIRFGEDADDLFVKCQLPEGWKKVATDHSMWSKLVDDKGRERAGIFYKAAFYDRSAHISLDRRFGYTRLYLNAEGVDSDYQQTTQFAFVVTDCGKEVFRAGTMPKPTDRWTDTDFAIEEGLEKACKDWLAQNYPNWNDATEYWD